jgi:hypothetical protein
LRIALNPEYKSVASLPAGGGTEPYHVKQVANVGKTQVAKLRLQGRAHDWIAS